jgi:hypothetical protein
VTQCSSTGIRNVHLKVSPNEEFPCHDCGIASLNSLRVKYKVRNVSIDRNTSAESKIVNGSRRSGVVGEGEEWFEKSLQCWLWWGRSGEEGQEGVALIIEIREVKRNGMLIRKCSGMRCNDRPETWEVEIVVVRMPRCPRCLSQADRLPLVGQWS